jgi:protein O-mannosyl-transferase
MERRDYQFAQTARSRPWLDGLLAAALVIAVFLAYQPAWQGGFIWDDDAHLTSPELRSWHGLYRIWFDLGATQQYYPLLHSAFWLEHKLWGDSPLGYHLVNILLHTVAALMVAAILRRLKVPGAYLAAAIFALHPVQVESVAWITELKNTLSAVFYLAAAMLYLGFDQERKKSFYAGALLLFVLGLLSKTVTATFPAALWVIFWWQRGRLSWRRDVLPLVPLFVLGAAAGLFTAWVERKLIGAEGAAFDLTIVDRFLISGRVIWFYLGKLFWPVDLIFIYPRWDINQYVWWQYLFPVAALLLAAVMWNLRRRWRGPLAGLLFFVGTMFPVLGFFNVFPFIYSFVADHFQYLASLGVITLVSAGIVLLFKRWWLWDRIVGYALCLALLSTLAILTWQQSRMYTDVVLLYQTTIEKNPNCWLAYNNLGKTLTQAGKPIEAIEYFRQALLIKAHMTEALNNMGNALGDLGRLQEAINNYQQALRIKPNDPEVHNNIGSVLGRSGRPEAAIEQYRLALQLNPDFPEAHNNLGAALMQKGMIEEAIEHYQKALQINSNYPQVHNNLGNALSKVGKPQEAIDQYQQALALKPDYPEAHFNLGLALVGERRIPEAIAHYRQALRFKPNFAEAYNKLGAVLVLADRQPEAIENFQKAITLKTDFVEAYANLATSYANTNRPNEAIAAGQKAIELARYQGFTSVAKKIEDWLNSYRAGLSNSQKDLPSSKPAAQPH